MKKDFAKKTSVFVIDGSSNDELTVKSVNLYDFVMESVDETTTPRGVAPRVHIRVNNRVEWWLDDETTNTINGGEDIETIELWTWGATGSHPSFTGFAFETIEEAEDYLFDRIYNYDFDRDCSRNTCYYNSEDEAFEAIAEITGLNIETVKSIEHHRAIAESIKATRRENRLKELAARNAMNERIANEYVALIKPIKGEKFNETAARLSQAIGTRIDKDVFFKAVSLIRKK